MSGKLNLIDTITYPYDNKIRLGYSEIHIGDREFIYLLEDFITGKKSSSQVKEEYITRDGKTYSYWHGCADTDGCSYYTKEEEKVENKKEKKGNDNMFNFEFGPVKESVKMSPYGLAIKNRDDKYVSYNPSTGEVYDVELFNFNASNFIYKMPAAIKDIAVGDIVVHNKLPMFVEAIKDGKVEVVDIYNGENKTILPTKSPFGFNFITKVVSLLDFAGLSKEASEESPFGNILPFMLLSNGDNIDSKAMFPLMLMSMDCGKENFNPLLFAAMANGDTGLDTNALLAMVMMNKGL